ncbi:MAG: hypothetical protein M3Y07_11920 [Acidobacteriota bacterium]|nr:hypothetical protein [Acidobacteriota bacterium]
MNRFAGLPAAITAPSRAGVTVLPVPSTRCESCGMGTLARGPAARMRDPSTTITESSKGAAPVPSWSVAPTIALIGRSDWS